MVACIKVSLVWWVRPLQTAKVQLIQAGSIVIKTQLWRNQVDTYQWIMRPVTRS